MTLGNYLNIYERRSATGRKENKPCSWPFDHRRRRTLRRDFIDKASGGGGGCRCTLATNGNWPDAMLCCGCTIRWMHMFQHGRLSSLFVVKRESCLIDMSSLVRLPSPLSFSPPPLSLTLVNCGFLAVHLFHLMRLPRLLLSFKFGAREISATRGTVRTKLAG